MQSRLVELVVGLFLCLGIAAIFILTFRVSSLQATANDVYTINASFQNVGGIKSGSAVSMAGVNIGRISDIKFDQETFEARIYMAIRKEFSGIPKDSSASILTAGLLGEKYIGIGPGGDVRVLEDGDSLKFTESALVLEQVIGQFLFSKAAEGKEK